MSATIMRVPPPGEAQVGRGDFLRVLHAEWTKFRTVRGWVIGMVVAILAMLLVGLFVAGSGTNSCNNGLNSPTLTGAACLAPVATGPDDEAVIDSFYFVRQPLTGNGSITVRLTSLTGLYAVGNTPAGQNPLAGMQKGLVPWAKAGVIITGSTKQGSVYAAMMITGSHGVHMQYDYTHDTAGQPGSVSPASSRWLRLTRAGGTLTGYESADGTHWSKVGMASLAGLPTTVQAGLFVTSPAYRMSTATFGGGSSESGPSIATAVFDHVSLQASTASAWTGTDIGASSSQLPASTSGFSDSGGSFTVTGSGDIAPVVPGAAGFPSVTIEQHLVGAFAALIAVIIIAAMFITAEFRRGLIRITFAASPRRGRVLAAKAIVIGSISFLAGLVAAVIALALGNHLARDGGYYVFPVSPFTEARVVVGTAALIAVAAILTISVGALLRRSAATVTVTIVAIVLPYILGAASVLPANAAQWLLRLTPAAAFAIQQSIPRYPQVSASYAPASGFFPLSPWAGLAVLCGYAAIALGLAFVLLRRRDA